MGIWARALSSWVRAVTSGLSGALGAKVFLDPMEEPIHDAQMKVEVGIEAGAETMEKADGPERGVRWIRVRPGPVSFQGYTIGVESGGSPSKNGTLRTRAFRTHEDKEP